MVEYIIYGDRPGRPYCINGHAYTAENSHIFKTTSGQTRRHCRECRKAISARFHEKLKENLKGQRFTCRSCKETLPLSEGRTGGVGYNGRGTCKVCHTYQVKNAQIRKKAELNPEAFMTCDDCDRVFSKYKIGARRQDGYRALKTACPFCQSKDIAQY